MFKLILLAALFAVVAAKHGYGGYGNYAVHYGFTAGGGHGGYGHGHGHGHGVAHVQLSQNPSHYNFGVKEGGYNNRYHYQTAHTPYGGYGHGGGGYGHGGGYGYGR